MLFRTDMADERRDLYRKANKIENEIEGIECEEEKYQNLKITRVKILNEHGEKALNKKKGIYITLDLKKENDIQDLEEEKIEKILANEISKLSNKFLKDIDDEILVVGLRK